MSSRHALAAMALGLLVSACRAVPINDMTGPTPVESTAAASIQVIAGSRPDQQLNISAEVLTKSGKPVVGAAVTFTATNGTITPSTATTDADGYAHAIASAAWQNTITASAAGLTDTWKIAGVVPTPPADDIALSISAGTIYEDESTVFGVNLSGGVPPIHVVEWAFGDGDRTSTNTFTPTHTYHSYGSYTVTLSVADDHGHTANASRRVSVLAAPVSQPPVVIIPALVLTNTCSNVTPLTVSCTESLTYSGTSVAGRIDSITWTWGDGSTTTRTPTPPVTTVSNLTAERVYAARGTYTITVDVHLTTGETATAKITYTF